KLGIDLRTVFMEPSNEFKRKAFPLKQYPERWVIKRPDGLLEDEWGIRYSEGATGVYIHWVYHPLQEKDISEYEFPDINAEGRFENAEKNIKRWMDMYALAASVEMTFFEQAWYLCGYRNFIKQLYENPSFVNKILDKLQLFREEQIKRFIEMGVDIIKLGDDIGMQTNMMLSPNVWRRFFKLRMQQLINIAKKYGDVFVFYHSDGYIEPIIPDLIEIGIDILDPVQPECMNPAKIKEKYGDKITLHGTISIQETLPFGSLEDVKNEILNRIRTCAPGGGLILGPTHKIQIDTPLENILTLYKVAKKYGKYPIRV
ncbi:MAG: uroporphyrinogen decarboxylase family protein, partial [Nitrososphaeria archaeon]